MGGIMIIKKYKKRPVIIEAVQFDGFNGNVIVDWVKNCNPDDNYVGFNPEFQRLNLDTLEGPMTASVGDYIIKGVKGEFYPCKPDIFKLTYDEAEE
jgi:hypothetical protein